MAKPVPRAHGESLFRSLTAASAHFSASLQGWTAEPSNSNLKACQGLGYRRSRVGFRAFDSHTRTRQASSRVSGLVLFRMPCSDCTGMCAQQGHGVRLTLSTAQTALLELRSFPSSRLPCTILLGRVSVVVQVCLRERRPRRLLPSAIQPVEGRRPPATFSSSDNSH